MQQQPFELAVADFVGAIGLLYRRLRSASAAQEISWPQAAVLARLNPETGMTTADLARAENVKPQSMGATLAALEELELVERRPHPTDGRQVLLFLTPGGVEVRERGRAARRSWLADAIAQLETDDQETLFAAAEIIRRLGEGESHPSP